MSEANKQVIRRLYGEVMAKGNTAVADEIFHPDFVDHMPIMKTPDRAGLLKAEYMGVPATDRPVTWTETHFWRVVEGQIVEHYGNVSMFEIHKMIGSHDLDSTLA